MASETTYALRVPLIQAEEKRKYYVQQNLLRSDLTMQKDDSFLYLPLKKIPKDVQRSHIVKRAFTKKDLSPSSYKDPLHLPSKLQKMLPSSFDVVGTILLIRLPLELYTYKSKIGQALLKAHHHITTVYLVQPVEGEFRTRRMECIAGKRQTRTIHKEYGLHFHVDVKETYFSPRLATERKRITSLVKSGEVIVDMFAGVAPFSVMIAHYASPSRIYANEKNAKAIALAKENVKKNKVLDKVEIMHSDAKDLPSLLSDHANRIIMNLPFRAHEYFPEALQIAKDICNIHYYDMGSKEEVLDRLEVLEVIARDKGYVLQVGKLRAIKSYSPREFYMGSDITATKQPM